jgi:hypothetical protein
MKTSGFLPIIGAASKLPVEDVMRMDDVPVAVIR